MRSCSIKHGRQLTRRTRNEGYVLVVVLAVIAIAAISLAGLARRSLQMTQQAAIAQEDLQRRWGVATCRHFVLEHAERILEGQVPHDEESIPPWPLPPQVESKFMLGDLRFEVTLADENAKVELNALYRRDPDDVRPAISTILSSSGTNGLTSRIVVPPTNPREPAKRPFQSWGQVFEPIARDAGSGIGRQVRDATDRLTCWGDGRLNIRRASDDAVRVVCQHDVGSDVIQKLLGIRTAGNIDRLDALLRQLSIRESERSALKRLLTDESTCHSLWLIVRNSRREWATLTIHGSGQSGGPQQESFLW